MPRSGLTRSQKEKVNSVPNSSNIVEMMDFCLCLRSMSPSLQRWDNVLSLDNISSQSWDDIGGLEDIKLKLKQLIEWPLKHAKTFARLGIEPSKGILLYGPPGCSKTSMVRIIAASSGATFISLNGAAVFNPYFGESEKMIRDTFARARIASPSIIFFDEIDAMVGNRGMEGNGGTKVADRILSTLLNEMDGVEGANDVLVIGATNKTPADLDAALIRAGRFDRVLFIPPPNEESRRKILEIHSKNMSLAEDVDLGHLAQDSFTGRCTGADLAALCREAAMSALRESLDSQTLVSSKFKFSL